jgi:Membrane-bound metallopeptidase
MVSTYLTFDLVNRDIQKSLGRISGQTMVANDTKYYQENIGKVKNLDEFLGDYRLYSYAMKAHGLEEMIYAKAFMKKVFESDLSDENSFANRLTDERYKNIAAAFNFGAAGGTAAAQSNGQMDELFETYDETVAALNDTTAEDTRYFKVMLGTLGNINSVDELLANDRLRDYLFRAYDYDAKYYNRDAIRGAMVSDPNDPSSFFNQAYGNELAGYRAARTEDGELAERSTIIIALPALQDTIQTGQTTRTDLMGQIAAKQNEIDNATGDTSALQQELDALQASLDATEAGLLSDQAELDRYNTRLTELNSRLVPVDQTEARREALQEIINASVDKIPFFQFMEVLANDFNFNPDGSVPPGGFITDDKIDELVGGYFSSQTRTTRAEAMYNQEYFEKKLPTITKASDITDDPRLLQYVKVAYGLDESYIVPSTIERILANDGGIVEQYEETRPQYRALYNAFNFQADGTVAAGNAQTEAQTSATRDGYMSRWDDKQEAATEKSIQFYKLDMAALKSVNDLFGSGRTSLNFALEAVGIELSTYSDLKLRNALKSDLSDPKSYIYTLKDPRLVKLAKLFNFAPDGLITTPVMAQSNATITNIAKDYILRKTRYLEKDELEAAKTKAQAEAKYYTDTIQRIENKSELLADRKLLDILLFSKGIDPETVTDDFLKKAFDSDLSDPKSFVNIQADKRFAQLVGTFNFLPDGEIDRRAAGIVQNGGEVITTQSMYVRQLLETEQGEENPGVRLALYFERMADSITDPYVILGDEALLEFFRVTFSMPAEMGSMDVDKQAQLVKSKLNLEDLSDPVKLKKLVQRFTMMYDIENQVISSGAVDILGGTSGSISADTLWALSQLKMR